jgi:hypothetical protein
VEGDHGGLPGFGRVVAFRRYPVTSWMVGGRAAGGRECKRCA